MINDLKNPPLRNHEKDDLLSLRSSEPIKLSKEVAEHWMRRLLKRAELTGSQGEVPVSAIILNENGLCIGYGDNTRNKNKDPLGHAELIAIKQASLLLGDWRLNSCTLIVTLEPCPMCAGAIVQARIGQLIYGAYDPKRGAMGSVLDLSKNKSSHHKMIVRGGVMEEEASRQLRNWFKTNSFIKKNH